MFKVSCIQKEVSGPSSISSGGNIQRPQKDLLKLSDFCYYKMYMTSYMCIIVLEVKRDIFNNNFSCLFCWVLFTKLNVVTGKCSGFVYPNHVFMYSGQLILHGTELEKSGTLFPYKGKDMYIRTAIEDKPWGEEI